MKTISKRIILLLLSLAVVISMSAVSFADSGTTIASKSSTGLADGTYTVTVKPDLSGSGRMFYIASEDKNTCKLTVQNGVMTATIRLNSSGYDKLYMSEAHWISYSIYVYIAGATSSGGSKINSSASSTVKLSKTHLTKKAPTIVGLNYKSTTKIKKAKYFKIYNYDKGVKLIEIDVAKKTALYKKNAKTVMASSKSEIEYDEEGNAIGKSENEFTEEIYQNNVVNYLVVPKGVEIPAGLEKDIIIIHQPAKKTFTTSKSATSMLKDLDSTKLTKKAGKETDLNYRVIIKSKTDLAILSSAMLPAKVEKVSKINIFKAKTVKKQKAKAKSMKIQLQTVEKRFTALGVPVVINRSDNEKGKLAKAEWIKVYGAIYGSSKEANKIFNKEAR